MRLTIPSVGTGSRTTLSHPLSQHIQRLNRIRQAVPALRKGQYSRTGCSGTFAFKRRYTDTATDSYALVAISGNATFTGIPNGTYTDCITGDVKTVTAGSLTASCSGKGNMRVYVLSTALTHAPGKIGADGKYLYTTSAASIAQPSWDGTQEELVGESDPSNPGSDPSISTTHCLDSINQQVVFFTASSDFGPNIYCYIWHTSIGSAVNVAGSWPGTKATPLGGGSYKFQLPQGSVVDNTWQIIWNDGSGNQTRDLKFKMRHLYTGADKNSIAPAAEITILCSDVPEQPTATQEADANRIVLYTAGGSLFVYSDTDTRVILYSLGGQCVAHLRIAQGENRFDNLPRGVYIARNQKIVL